MEYIAKSHYKLLKKLHKHELKKSQLTESESEDITYLGENGCIRYEGIYENEDSMKQIDTLIILRSKGKAVYETYVRNRRRWLIPVIISIVAAIISIIALYKSSQPLEININEITNAESIVSKSATVPTCSGKSG